MSVCLDCHLIFSTQMMLSRILALMQDPLSPIKSKTLTALLLKLQGEVIADLHRTPGVTPLSDRHSQTQLI